MTSEDRLENYLLVRLWNDFIPEGSEVFVTRDDDSVQQTKTRSEAWLLGCGIPVVKVEGITGGYRLERVRPA